MFQKKDFEPEFVATQIWNKFSEVVQSNLYESIRLPPYFEKNNRTMNGNLIIFGVSHLTVFNLGNLSREIVKVYPQGVCLDSYKSLRLSIDWDYVFGIRELKIIQNTCLQKPSLTFHEEGMLAS